MLFKQQQRPALLFYSSISTNSSKPWNTYICPVKTSSLLMWNWTSYLLVVYILKKNQNHILVILVYKDKNMLNKSEKLIAAIDQGTSSSRVLLFSPIDWTVQFVHQKEFASIYPHEGWSEQDPLLILATVKEVSCILFFMFCRYSNLSKVFPWPKHLH